MGEAWELCNQTLLHFPHNQSVTLLLCFHFFYYSTVFCVSLVFCKRLSQCVFILVGSDFETQGPALCVYTFGLSF